MILTTVITIATIDNMVNEGVGPEDIENLDTLLTKARSPLSMPKKFLFAYHIAPYLCIYSCWIGDPLVGLSLKNSSLKPALEHDPITYEGCVCGMQLVSSSFYANRDGYMHGDDEGSVYEGF